MEQILHIRESIIGIIKRHETVLIFCFKFIIGLILYRAINNLGFASTSFKFLVQQPFSFIYITFLALLFASLPLSVNYIFIILNLTLQFSSQIELALIVFLVLLSIFLFYGHLGRTESCLIIAVVMGFYFNIPYGVPIFAGLYFGIISLIPIIIGTFIWSYSQVIISMMTQIESSDELVYDVGDIVIYLYNTLNYEYLNAQLWIAISISFTLVLISVYVLSKSTINYSKELAIIVGVLISIIGFAFIGIFIDYSINFFAVTFFSVLSGIIIAVIRFFDIVLDYSRAEKVEFEDEDNYYYVKVIPKIRLKKSVINSKSKE